MIARLIAVSSLVLFVSTGPANATPSPPYYLALGDSLALGIQPNAAGVLVPTNQGYVDHLYALAKLRQPSLRLAKLGCSGETTTTMIGGGVCAYTLGSQLADAVAFIQTHRVAFITLSIGGANVLDCFSLAGIDPECVEDGLDAVGPELGQILAALRAAAGPGVRIVGMNYYDPFLAASILGPQGQALAAASLQATNLLNDLLGALYYAFQVPVADVAGAYRINDATSVPVFNLPLNVLLELRWTWIGSSPPVGPDIHPNATGYSVIALAFLKAFAG